MEREAGGDVQDPVAQALGFGFGEVSGQEEALRPGDQVVRDSDQGEPDLVVVEVVEREVAQPGVFVVADVI